MEISTVLQMCFQIFSNTQFALRFFQGPICFEMSVLSDLFSAHHFSNFFQYTICFYFNFSKARFVFRCQISQFFFNESFVFRFFQHTIFHEAHFIIQSVPLLTLLSSYLGIVLNFAQERRYNILQNKSHFVQYHIFPFHQKLDVVVNLIYKLFFDCNICGDGQI